MHMANVFVCQCREWLYQRTLWLLFWQSYNCPYTIEVKLESLGEQITGNKNKLIVKSQQYKAKQIGHMYKLIYHIYFQPKSISI